jgi:hypothetical protein
MLRRFRAIIILFAAFAVASCAQLPEVQQMPDGAILYSPRHDERVRPSIETQTFVYTEEIVDRLTGYRLYREGTRSIPEIADTTLTLWRVDRSRDGLPAVYFLTRPFETEGNWLSRRSGLEIVHAHEDGFFPFRDALEPSELSFERIAFMLDRYGEKERPRLQVYLDNRHAYRAHREVAQGHQDLSPFIRANFNLAPQTDGIEEVLYPLVGAARFDAQKGAAFGSDDTSFKVTHGNWSPFLDRSGRPAEFRAEWKGPDGRNPWVVRMICLRSYREGYGETRAVEIVAIERPSFRGSSMEIESPGRPPSWSDLAELINASVPIAGPHTGHMVVVVSKDAVAMAGEV